MKKHMKHAFVKKPDLGQFGRVEIALIGAPCDVIKNTVQSISAQVSESMTVTYIDADHHAADQLTFNNLTDRISHDSIDFEKSLNDYDRKILLSNADLLLVNGNHFKAKKQIVFCTQKKKVSLQKKLDRLNDVGLIILDRDIDQPHEFLKSTLANINDIPICNIDELHIVSDWIQKYYSEQIPEVRGLVLAGGKSQRMGINKATLDYHGMPQVSYACQQMVEAGIDPAISCRSDQNELFTDQFPLLHDAFIGLGPFGALLTAFKSNPDVAWLVMACDQPLINEQHLSELIRQRDPSKIATCYHNPETGFPEPIITLWEPKAYPRLLSFLSLGYSCPRKVLINSDVKEVVVDDASFMINANTPEERKAVLAKLSV